MKPERSRLWIYTYEEAILRYLKAGSRSAAAYRSNQLRTVFPGYVDYRRLSIRLVIDGKSRPVFRAIVLFRREVITSNALSSPFDESVRGIRRTM